MAQGGPPGRVAGAAPLLFIQYGDFRAAFLNLRSGGEEDYQAQRRSVDFKAGLARAERPVTVLNVVTESAFDEVLPDGPRAIGLGPRGYALSLRQWWRLLDQVDPAQLVLRTPLWPVLVWAAWRRRRTLVVLADSFAASGRRGQLRNMLMARLLNAGVVGAVGNHGRRASAQLAEIGVDRRKIIPWDWAPARTPHEQEPKCSASNDGAVTLLFAGALARSKGVDDLVEAAGVLRQRGRKVRVDLLGGGDIERLRALAEEKGVADAVTLHGKVANRDVVPMMRAADMVIVPSHHDYPEGLPLTIYEALVSRTPIVASDHPMFSGNIVDGVSALIFPAGNAGALADRVEQLLDNPALYERLSRNGAAAWERLQLPVTFEDLVARWLEDDRDWLRAHSLAERNYAAAALSAAESA